MDIILGVSLLITFLAGMVALFAPCCIGFLFPAYLGAIFRERKQVLGMTFVFALGILTVFLPIGAGVGAVGSLLNRWHDQFFFAGAMMLVAFGLLLLLGKNIMVHVPIPRVTAQGYSSVYVLGIFSGIGTSCCAPVFAGVATLSALSGSALGGAVLASVYVFGMVLPLFVVAWAWDRADVGKRFSVLQRTVSWGLGRFRFKTIFAHIVAGAIFIIAGAVIFWLTASGKIMAPAGWQRTLSEEVVSGIERVAPWLFSLSNIIWLLLFIIIVAYFLYSILRFRNRK